MQLSKKQPCDLSILGLTSLALLISTFPNHISPPESSSFWRFPLYALLAFLLARLLHHGLPLRHPLRLLLWLPVSLPPPLLFQYWPAPVSLIVYLVAWALLLLLSGKGWEHEVITLAVLTLGAAALTHTLLRYPPAMDVSIPRMLRWSIFPLVGIPFIFSMTRNTRPVARGMLILELLLTAATLFALPLLWLIASSAKEPGELARQYYAPRPEARYVAAPGTQPPLPGELESNPNAVALLRFLDERLLAISPPALKQLFSEDTPLSPPEMIRAFKIYGLLLEDIHGYHIPDSLYAAGFPTEISSDFHPWITQLREHTRISAMEIGELRSSLIDLGWIIGIPAENGTFRLTAQARRPLSNGLRPRQILCALATDPISIESYRNRHGLSPYLARDELEALRESRVLHTRTWTWNAHREVLRNPLLGGLALAALLFALLLPRFRPANLCLPASLLALSLWIRLAPGLIAPNPLPLHCAWATLMLPASLLLLLRISQHSLPPPAPLSLATAFPAKAASPKTRRILHVTAKPHPTKIRVPRA